MSQNIFYFLQQITRQLERQESSIKQLQKKQKALEKELTEVKEKPVLYIDRIEYQFDQLKIDRLEGTLNIGLNPKDLQDMDEFAIDTLPFHKMQDRYLENIREQLEHELNAYLDTELPEQIDKIKHENGLDIDESYTQFIIADIRQQLRERIDFYLKQQLQEMPQTDREDTTAIILEKIKNDIDDAVQKFFKQFPGKGA
ncbi:MAG: spore germination protein GerPC [Caldibacillus sp.]